MIKGVKDIIMAFEGVQILKEATDNTNENGEPYDGTFSFPGRTYDVERRDIAWPTPIEVASLYVSIPKAEKEMAGIRDKLAKLGVSL